jgi:hypothetical protein
MIRNAPLHAFHFERIAEGGLGDPQNILAHSMAWFKGRLYVGLSRTSSDHDGDGLSGAVERRRKHSVAHSPDQKGRIWMFDAHTRKWSRVFESPVITGRNGKQTAREIGYRAMAVFRGRTDFDDSLYVSGISSEGAAILRSSDGMNFSLLTHGTGVPGSAWSLRSLVPVGGRVFSTPTGTIAGDTVAYNRAARAVVLEMGETTDGEWKEVSAPGFGDPTNVGIFELAAANGFLYAGTLNPYAGFQLWKAPIDAVGTGWKQVLNSGGFRGNTNESIVSLCPFGDALYIGTGIQGLSYDPEYHAGPGAAEILRVYPDDSWDLIVGQSRATFNGFKSALSGFGPGFGNPCNCVVWRMAAHEGWLYAGTFDWSSMLHRQPRVGNRFIGAPIQEEAGFDLWRSPDGVQWAPVTRVGLGGTGMGVRTLVSTEKGLFLGTQGPFHSSDGSFAESASGGGCEVWWGHRNV